MVLEVGQKERDFISVHQSFGGKFKVLKESPKMIGIKIDNVVTSKSPITLGMPTK